ncbi:hypothetical protein V501_01896 [Pseudogymnoascus sp. VKM F-4519 (FW-2642)]|nr:hypothetical protein V500_03157 [Pseudogymnoascus sp. VKM F-4518 (FW-2643)]KFZ17105.1 hypothetical protein V501_01896 [Pseudogymnoascus sp. VKM F-4519 (FW-2642)]
MCIDQFGVRRALLALEDQQLMENMEWSFNQFFFASVLDPFGSLALDTLDNRVIHVHILAPAMFPLDIDGRSNPLKTTWFPFVVTDPALMQATLCIAAAHYQRFGGESLGSTQDLLRMQAIGLINQRLGDSVECISDGTIGAVLGLAESEVSDTEQGASTLIMIIYQHRLENGWQHCHVGGTYSGGGRVCFLGGSHISPIRLWSHLQRSSNHTTSNGALQSWVYKVENSSRSTAEPITNRFINAIY